MGVYKMTEWESESGWHCNDVSDLGHGSGYWWHAARACNMTPADFIKFLINNYHPDKISYHLGNNCLLYSWNSQVKMREFKNFVNAQARKNNYQI